MGRQADIIINEQLIIRVGDYEESFIRAGGPGGQNVNKVATAVQLRLYTKQLNVPAHIIERLIKLAGRRATREGDIIIEANRFRTQERNRDDARERLARLIRQALEPPPPPRKKTKPTKGAIQRRLQQKANRSLLKKLRRKVNEANSRF